MRRRSPPLWAGRFKNTVLAPGRALWACWACWAYVECNPVRAKIVADPADYRFCSYGEWAQTGRHPFADAVARFLAPALPTPFAATRTDDALGALKARFARENAAQTAQRCLDTVSLSPVSPLTLFEGIDGVLGNGDEMVRIGGVYEAVLVGGRDTGISPIS